MNYKLIVLDMDDTLLSSKNEILPSTIKALIDAQNNGAMVVLASGRPTGGMIDAALKLQLDKHRSYIISYNGAVVTKMNDHTVIDATYVEYSEFKEILQFLRKEDVMALTYKENKIYYEGQSAYEQVEGELTGLEMIKVDNLQDVITEDVPKVMGVGNIELIQALNKQLDGNFGEDIHATTSKPFFLEFMHSNVSKGKVLRRLAEQLGIHQSEIIAFGDSNNDKDMLEFAGLGVAMGNANAMIKEVADVITLSHDEDGIAQIIEEYILKK
ncbi:Cof-type HAD-IIB family hydrolase [Macrococcus caseolyticus]|uniref:Cof-type HAD-IIB family hydrolase n=1 Tax=Macrococcoides caseolyticum TaxID=69966 RepID=UPI00119DE5D3|nr:Cof-type HAD-IIB family hydrolase [Macrococcus caseolyticus]MDJ1091195.1 Cof-type HAD-IIB family hydrolase [Macrococcus caseolyticus]MDJ1153808.1 Cof-type HAD-IIB family hydrolase [Macrococcus caseolyticus]